MIKNTSIYLKCISFIHCICSCALSNHFTYTQRTFHRISSSHKPESQMQTWKRVPHGRLQIQTPGAAVNFSFCFSIYNQGLLVLNITQNVVLLYIEHSVNSISESIHYCGKLTSRTSIFTQHIGSMCFPLYISTLVMWEELESGC